MEGKMEDKLYRSTGSEGSLTDIRWKNRNVSLDILRILCMFLIVLGHAMIHGQVLDAVAANSPNYFLLHVLRAFLSVHVNCFVLISGYFLCTHEFRIRKFFSLWGQAFFWSLTLYLFLCISGFAPFALKSLLKACLPFTQQRYWFVPTYLLMYLLVPILNAAVRSMSQRQHAYFLAVFFTVYIALQNLFFWEKFTSTNSYDPLFFAFLYLIAAYFRMYPAKRTKRFYLLCYIAACAFATIWKIGMSWLSVRLFGEVKGDIIFLSYNSITMVIASACFFRFFEGLRITKKKIQRIAPLVSSLTFGIYLIHEQPEVRTFLWQKLLCPFQFVQNPFLVFILLGIAITVFSFCAVLEYIRQRISHVILPKSRRITLPDKLIKRVEFEVEKAFKLEHAEDEK